MNPIKKLSLLLSALLVGGLCFPAAASDFTVRTAGTLPPPASGGVKNPGVAGAFIGGIGDRIVVAGGSNFAQGAPWDGGAKQFEDAIYLLTPANASWRSMRSCPRVSPTAAPPRQAAASTVSAG